MFSFINSYPLLIILNGILTLSVEYFLNLLNFILVIVTVVVMYQDFLEYKFY